MNQYDQRELTRVIMPLKMECQEGIHLRLHSESYFIRVRMNPGMVTRLAEPCSSERWLPDLRFSRSGCTRPELSRDRR